VSTHRRIETLGAIVVMGGASLTTSVPAYGQTMVLIPEMVVTSRAREEALQDVPISVSLVSGDTIEETGIENLEELAGLVPNFTVVQDPIGDKLNIRGIFTSEVPSLEQSVSTFIDGVNRGRGAQARLDFLDLERVEVLRGPQETLFGKNTVGGALSLTTRKPTPTFEANLNVGYETELEETTVGGVISGPFTEAVRGRLAYSFSDQDEGFIDNVLLGNSAPLQKDNLARGTLEFDLTESTLLRLRADYADFETQGQPFSLTNPGPLAPLLQPFGLAAGSLRRTAIAQNPAGPLAIGNVGEIEGDSQEVAVTLEQQFKSGGELEVIGAYTSLDFDRSLDADFSPLDALGVFDSEDFEQASLSVRFLSDDSGRVRYIAGLYYQQSELSLSAVTSLNTPVFAGLSAAGCQAAGLTPTDAQLLFGAVAALNMGLPPPDVSSQLVRAGSAAVVNACTSFGALQTFPTPLSRFLSLDQDVDVGAVYTQVDFDLTPSLQFTLGVRYTVEEKQARQRLFAADFGTLNPNAALNPALFTLLESTPHDFSRDQLDRKENKTTYSGTLQWKATDTFNAYISTSSGFKAGGFNVAALSASAAEAEFGPEEVVAYELGFKAGLFGGRAQLNAAFFFTDIEDLQGSQFTGGTSFIVQNAAEAETKGVEVDARYQFNKDIGVSVAASYTDFEFTSFPRPGCSVQQVLALREATFAQGGALLVDGDPTNDAIGLVTQLLGSNQTQRECSNMGINNLQGRTGVEVPDFTAQLGLDYHVEFGNFAIDALGQLEYNDEQFRQTDLDPVARSGSFAKTNLALAFYRMGSPWKVSLIGRNIFDKDTFSYRNDTPLVDNARQSIIDKPRTVRVQLQYEFE
jgi:iron complex outermembrane recepter protein